MFEYLPTYLSVGAALYFIYLFGSANKEISVSAFIRRGIFVMLLWPFIIVYGVRMKKNEKK